MNSGQTVFNQVLDFFRSDSFGAASSVTKAIIAFVLSQIGQMIGSFAEKLFLGKQKGYKRLNCWVQAIAEAFRQDI